MRLPLLFASAIALAACTSHDAPTVGARGDAATSERVAAHSATKTQRQARQIAALPDRGRLLAYAGTEPVRRTAYTWHPAALSESHALRAIATGTMEVDAPDGTPIRLRYTRHLEHADGNWTWIGRPDGARPGTEAIITFGEKAVFGSVPNGDGPPLRITTTGGRTWVMETDPRALKRMVAAGRVPDGTDFAAPPALAGARDKVLTQAAIAPQKLTAAGAVPESATVDLVVGYTNTFASRLGGTSQALTRLRYLVDVANIAFSNSQIVGQVRLAGTVAVNYPDATDNGAALDALTGVVCTDTGCEAAPIPAALQPLHDLRENVGGDLISLVRNFSDPENDSCGIAWLLGSGQDPITVDMAYAGVSVVSDSNGNQFPDNDFVCRDETFVHEIAHNMGSAHDEVTAQDGDGVTDPEDYGRYPYSFGYKTAVGNFYTIMAYRDDGQQPYRVFSNPRITYCGGNACGTANADNARSLGQTIPVIAAFAVPDADPPSDFNGDRKSDILWRHGTTGANSMWPSASSAAVVKLTAVADAQWKVVGSGDFNADGRSDILWRNFRTGLNSIWRSGNSATVQAVAQVAATSPWIVAGVGDFDGDGRADILWRNNSTGTNSYWKGGNLATPQPLQAVATVWKVIGVGDFDGDGRSDILWRNSTTGAVTTWGGANVASARQLGNIPGAWIAGGVGDFDGNGRADIAWRHTGSGANAVWWDGMGSNGQALTTVADLGWTMIRAADYDGDGRDDILWRNTRTGQNSMWRGADSTRALLLTTITDQGWKAF